MEERDTSVEEVDWSSNSICIIQRENFLKQVEKVGRLNGKMIVIDESHIFFQNVISGKARQAIEVFEMMFNARDNKYLFLTGTPISGDPFELVPMFNLLKGKMFCQACFIY